MNNSRRFFEKVQENEKKIVTKDSAKSYFLQHKNTNNHIIILVHGFSACPATLKPIGHYLYEKGSDVYGLRVAGHGTSLQDFEQKNWQDWERSLETIYQELRQHYEHVSVIGSSMGALLSLRLAAKYPLKKLVCMGTFLKPQNPWFYSCYLLSPLAYLWPFSWGKIPNGTIPEHRSGFWYEELPRKSIINLFRIQQKAKKCMSQVTIPTLVAHAANDTVAHPDSAHRLLNGLNTIHKKLLWIGNEHVFVIDKDPDIYDAIRYFITD
ncbi:MAG: alpha/beta fold hydrolase [bacterium]